MIIGIGVDMVDIARFERQLERTPKLRERLFTPAERIKPRSRWRPDSPPKRPLPKPFPLQPA